MKRFFLGIALSAAVGVPAFAAGSAPDNITTTFAGSSAITFEANAVTARVTPGAQTVWLMMSRSSRSSGGVIERRANLLTDADYDGVVSWPQSRAIEIDSTWGVLDVTSKQFHVATPGSLVPTVEPLNYKLLRDRDGNYTWIDWQSSTNSTLVWVRPGVGAWRVSHGFSLASVANPFPVGNSPRSPRGFRYGDYLVAVRAGFVSTYFVERVDERLIAAKSAQALIEIANSTIYEKSGTVRPHLTRRGSTEATTTVDFATADDTAIAGTHYTPASGTITFQPGEVFKDLPVTAIDDATYSGPTSVRVNYSNVTGAILKTATQLYTITEDEPAPSITPIDMIVTEGDSGAREIPVKVTLTGATRVAASVGWYWTGRRHTGAAGTLVFAPGEHEKTVVIPYTADTAPETDDLIEFALHSAVNAKAGRSAAIWINDDDGAISIRPDDVIVAEGGGTVHVPVRLSAPHNQVVSVEYDLVGIGSTDIEDVQGTLTFAPGVTRRDIAVSITQDTNIEQEETYSLHFFAEENATLRRSSAKITIVDDDVIPVISLAETRTIRESAASNYQYVSFRISEGSKEPVSFHIRTSRRTATPGRDYDEVSGPFTVPAGWPSAGVQLRIANDTIRETDETFELTITDVKGATVQHATTVVTIEDDDSGALPGINADDVTFQEGLTSSAEVELRLSSVAENDVTVVATAIAGTAAAGTDFEPFRKTVRIPAGRTTAVLSIPLVDDAVAEDVESLTIELSEPVNALIETPAPRITILDRDSSETPTVSVQDVSTNENVPVAVFTLTLSSTPVAPLLIEYQTIDGTAIAGEDYTHTQGSVLFAAGELTKTVEVPLVNDRSKEADETFTLRAGAAEAVCTIVNRDAAGRSRSVRR